MNKKEELKEIMKLIEENTTDAWEDNLENTSPVVVLADFDRKVQGEKYDKDPSVKYNGWYERLKKLSKSL